VTKVAIQSLQSVASDAGRLASRLGIVTHEIEIHRFPDGELRVTIGPVAPVTIIYAPLDRPNDKLLAILFATEALRRNGAERVILVAPYLCYMRQDTAFHPREAISQRVIGKLLADVVDRIITVDAHLHRTVDICSVFPGIEADDLSAMPAIADAMCESALDPATVVVGPDAESVQWVSELAGRLGLIHAVGKKTRHGDRSVDIIFPAAELIKGRPVLLVDDIVSSGGTLIACAKTLVAAGAKSIDAIVTHALFPPELTRGFAQAGIRSIRSTNSVSHPTNAILLDAVLAVALQREIDAGSVTERS